MKTTVVEADTKMATDKPVSGDLVAGEGASVEVSVNSVGTDTAGIKGDLVAGKDSVTTVNVSTDHLPSIEKL